MSGKGNCYDNSAIESFLKSIKAELVLRRNWQTRREVEIALFEYINGFLQPTPQTLGARLEITRSLRTEGHLT